jgi:hypothetical protein
MRCDAPDPNLSAWVDGELGPADAARIEAHVRECEPCRAALRAWRDAGRSLRREDAAADPADRILAAVRERRAHGTARTRRRSRWLLVPAAAVALVVPVILYRQALADREVRELVDLEGRNRVDAVDQIQEVEALRFEIAALLVRARAASLAAEGLQDLEREARELAEEAVRMRQRLYEIDSHLKREGLLRETTEVRHETRNR